ncbi:MAG: Mce protein [Mycobacterium sp.]
MGPPRDSASAGARDEEHDDDPVAAPSGERRWSARRHRATRLRWITAAALVAVLVGAAGYVGGQRLHQHQKEVAGAQALEAARKYVVTLTNIDSNAIDQTIADILDGSTGEFRDLYNKSSGQLRQLLVDNRAAARGHVVEAVVKSAGTKKVEVVLFVDQSVTNLAYPEPRIDRSRVRMTMEKVDGRWLVSRVELP